MTRNARILCAALVLAAVGPALPGRAGAQRPAAGGIDPVTLKLPDGPGSVAGLNDAVSVGSFDAQVSYRVPIDVPAGHGLAPAVSLDYAGGQGNGPLGIGWSLGVPAVRRSLRQGVPSYDESDELVLGGVGGGGRLVAIGGGEYRVEGQGNRVRVRRTGERFEVTDPDGVTYYFGLTAASRKASGHEVAAWFVELVVDTAGHAIRYEYTADRGELYLSRITWGPSDAFALDVAYQPRADTVVSYLAGFEVHTDQRIQSVTVTSFSEVLRRYDLSYDDTLAVTRLASVTQVGRGGAGALPTLSFSYADLQPATVTELSGTGGWALDSRGVALMDVDGDGVSDLIRLEAGNHSYRRNYAGAFGTPVEVSGSTSAELETSRLIDLDGDARPELVRIINDTWRVYRLAGDQWQAAGPWPGTAGLPLAAPDGVLADLDGDGRADLIRATALGLLINDNTGDGMASERRVGSVSGVDPPVEPGAPSTRMYDVNGDGLADVVWLTDAWMKVFLGRGDGSFALHGRIFYPWTAGSVTLDDLHLCDLNRDGLMDVAQVTAGHVLWYPGQGNLALSSSPRHVVRPAGADADVRVAIADVNGNGSADVVWSSPRGMWALDLAGPTSAGMLAGIENGLGKLTTIEYGASGQLSVEAELAGATWVHKLPVSIPVPVGMTVDPGEGPARSVRYGVAEGFWDGEERRFGGFLVGRQAVAGTSAVDARVDETRFYAGIGDERVLRGQPWYQRVAVGGVVHTISETTWQALEVTGLTAPLLRKAVVLEQHTYHHEGMFVPIETATRYVYDGEGRPIQEYADGRLDLVGDEAVIVRRFASDDTTWVRDRVCEEQLYETGGVTPAAAPGGALVSHTRSYFGDETTQHGLCVVGKGWATRAQAYLASEARWVTLSTTRYDAEGNPIEAYADGVTRRYGYDANRLHPIRETVEPATGATLSWQLSWDDVLGAPQTLTDPAGLSMTVSYDSLGRLIGVAQGTGPAHARYEYDWTAPRPRTRAFVFDGSAAELAGAAPTDPKWRQSVTVANGAGETLYAASEVADAGTRWAVSGWVQRDRRGRVVLAAEPFYLDGAAVDAALPSATRVQTIAYDGLDRIIEQTLPTGAQKRLSYLAFEQTVHADELDPVTSLFDGLTRITHTQRPGPGGVGVESVDAVYDAAGRLLSMQLQGGAVEHTFVYDTLGRLIAADDPDIGPRTLGYDDRGWLLTETNAQAQTIRYGYDDIGRLTSVLADDGSAFAYHYDTAVDPGTYRYTAGRLATIDEPTGQVQLGYDDFGRQVRYARRIDGTSVQEVSAFATSGLLLRADLDSELSFEVGYDPAGRPIRITETGSATAYGDLWSIADPGADLDAAGRIVRESYGNGVAQRYEYDANGAPSRVHIERPVAHSLYDVIVARNAWSGITSVTDGAGAGLDHSASFTYDGAARLTAATLGVDGPNQYAFSYAYDGLQNMIKREISGPTTLGAITGDYEYGGTRPDMTPYGPRQLTRVAAIGDPATTVAMFDYDKAGRQLQRDGKTLSYNGLDQLTAVTGLGSTGAGIVTHAYGYDGLRVQTTAVDGEVTNWFTPSIYERGGERHHYIKLGDRLIARIVKRPDPGGGGGATLVPFDARAADALRIAVFAAGLLMVLAVLWRTRRRALVSRRWLELTAALAIVAIAQGGCTLFGSARQYAWQNGEILYFHHGYAPGPVLVTRADATIHAERRYEPFGEGVDELQEPPGGGFPAVGPIDYTREQFNILNKPADPDTGWSYHGARWMAPDTARWLTPDPPVKGPDPKFMAAPWALHPYQYVKQNPVAYWDPDGRNPAIAACALVPQGCAAVGAAAIKGGFVVGTAAAAAGAAVWAWGAYKVRGPKIKMLDQPLEPLRTPPPPPPRTAPTERPRMDLARKPRGTVDIAPGPDVAREDPDQKRRKLKKRVFYHGTDIVSAGQLLAGVPLNAELARRSKYPPEKEVSPVGFYLTPHIAAAEYFAARRAPGGVLEYTVAMSALGSLLEAGAYVQEIPAGGLPASPGLELFIPPKVFPLFNKLQKAGQITVKAN